jgi:hypothetical protein
MIASESFHTMAIYVDTGRLMPVVLAVSESIVNSEREVEQARMLYYLIHPRCE